MEKIAFLGLGRMGLPMARRLAAAGHPLTVWNRSPGRADGLTEDRATNRPEDRPEDRAEDRAEERAEERGAGLAANRSGGVTVAATPAEAVRGADVVVTMLSDPAAVAEVAGRCAAQLAPGALWIDMSSIGPRATAELRGRLPVGVALVDAPVIGSVGPAATGDLVVFAGGEEADVDRALPVLERLGRVRRCGGPGSGAALKVVVIGAVVASVTSLGEVMAVADELGVPREQVREVLSVGPLAGVVARAFSTESDFPVRLAAKDLSLAGGGPVLRAAREVLLADPSIAERDLSAVVTVPRAVAV